MRFSNAGTHAEKEQKNPMKRNSTLNFKSIGQLSQEMQSAQAKQDWNMRLLMKSNFHQIRIVKKEMERQRLIDEAKKKQAASKVEGSLLGELDEHEKEEDEETQLDAQPSMSHVQTIEDEQEEEYDDELANEAKKFVRFAQDGKTVELYSPQLKGCIKIKNTKIPIISSALRFEELKHIEDAILGM